MSFLCRINHQASTLTMDRIYSVITATGSCIPPVRIPNDAFLENTFFESSGIRLEKSNREIIDRFLDITTITERAYVAENQTTSDIAVIAAKEALTSSNTDPESLDYLIVAHNFGETLAETRKSEYVPCLAARVKQQLGIKNPGTVAYDISFGCPGWLQAVIQSDYFIRSGDAKRIMVIGAEVLSRVSDPHDRDSMIYADGAGAVILEGRKSDKPIGILAHKTQSDSLHYANMLHMGPSYNPSYEGKNDHFLKMNGRKLYQYALEKVPQAMKKCLDSCQINVNSIKKVLIHQANGKMDEAILSRFYTLCGETNVPENVMPMTIDKLGNSSVASLPTLLDLIVKNKIPNQEILPNDTVLFASVGAGMSINALVYRFESLND